MSFREILNKNPGLSTGLAAAFVVGVVLLIWWQVRAMTPPMPGAYYTTDDGTSYFADDPKRVTPFDHKGKPAVRAHVFRGSDGKTFVGYLERNTPQAGAIITRVQNRKPADPPPTPAEMGIVLSGKEYKRPGTGTWVPMGRADEVRKITAVTAPDGKPAVEVE